MSTSVQRVETGTGLCKIYIIYDGKPANLCEHVERNVLVHLKVSYFLVLSVNCRNAVHSLG
jgi:hypothetical protein